MESNLTLFPAPLYGTLRPGCGWLQDREKVAAHLWSCLGKVAQVHTLSSLDPSSRGEGGEQWGKGPGRVTSLLMTQGQW